MVRTFLCHPFKDPKAFTDQYDPTAICYTGDDRVIIASVHGTFHIYNLKHINCPKLQKLSSIGISLKMFFCNSKQFILSLETRLQEYKNGVSPISVNCYVRVYLNITSSVTNKVHPTIINGYTASVTQLTCNKYLNSLTVIDLNVNQPASDVALCQITSNIAVSSGKKVFIYACKSINFFVDNEDKELIDFFKIIEIDFAFYLHNISFVANWLAVASRTELRILQIFLSQPYDENVYQAEDVSEFLESCRINESAAAVGQQHKLSAESQNWANETVALDKNFVVWNFNQNGNEVPIASLSPDKKSSLLISTQDKFALNSDKNLINLAAISEETPYIDRNTTAKEIIGPLENLVGHPLHVSVSFQEYEKTFKGTASCITLLYRRFTTNEMSNSGDIDGLHSLQWLPVCVEGENTVNRSPENTSWPWNMFEFSLSSPLMTLAFFFSTGKQGYLYDLNGNIRQAACYNYTSDCFTALHTTSILHTVTKNGLESYTSRLYPLAAEHCLEIFKDVDLGAASFVKQPAPYRMTRSETQQFTEINYFGSYVSIRNDGTVASDNEACKHNPAVIYSPHVLTLPCPSLDLDVCLLGMYLLQNITMVGCSASYTGMLVKANLKEKSGGDTVPAWSMYVLEKTPVADFYNELIALIVGNEFSNPTIYYQLSCEAHLLLRSELMSGVHDEDEMKDLLKQSAVNIGDFLSRCTESFPFKLIREYYAMGGLEFKDVIQKCYTNEIQKDKKYVYSDGFVEYLNSVLFGVADVELEEDLSEFILKIYLKNQPSMLSTVILKSKLKNFTDALAVNYLSKFRKKLEGKGKKITYFDYLCLAVLHMNLGNPDNVEGWLKEVPEEALKKLVLENDHLIFDDIHYITPLGQLIKKRFKSTFIAILVIMFDVGKFTGDKILNIFQKKDDPISYSSQACKVFEILINDGSRKKHFSKLISLLIDQYLKRIVQLSKGIVSDSWKRTHSHVPKGNGHFAPRFSWLDKLHPFTGEPPCPQDCVVHKDNNKKHRNGASSSKSSPRSLPVVAADKKSSPHMSSFPSNNIKDNENKRIYCPCCCCSEILLKFQSLLCSRHNRKELSARVLSKLTDLSFVGKDSLMVLCWPKVDEAKEAVTYMLKNYPTSTLQYAKELFDWKAQWQVLLEHILLSLRNNDYEQWNHDAYIAVLKGVLLRLTRAYTPAEFLSLLPSDGAIQFFLPYLHECWEYSKSSVLQQQFLDTYKDSNVS